MSMMSGARLAVAAWALGAACIAHAAENDAGRIKSGPGALSGNATAMISAPRQAPVGHRQPRTSDIPAVELSGSDIELRREDELIDRKLLICRGC